MHRNINRVNDEFQFGYVILNRLIWIMYYDPRKIGQHQGYGNIDIEDAVSSLTQ